MSASRKLESPAPAIAFAGLAVCMGLVVIGIATGVIPYEAEDLTAPRWLVALAGGMFVASAVVPLATVFPRLAPMAPMAGAFIALVLLVLVHWVAFGDGERQFSSGGSPSHGALRSPVSERLGRIWFGAIAVVLDGVVLLVLGQVLRERVRGHDRSSRSGEAGTVSGSGKGLKPGRVPRIPIRRA